MSLYSQVSKLELELELELAESACLI